MGDEGEFWNDVREARRRLRREYGIDCPGCVANYPKRSPTILLPKQRCRVCGYVDARQPPDVGKASHPA